MLDDKRPARSAGEEACGQIHSALERLPLLASPGEVPFDDGLYFFYGDGEASEHAALGRVVRVGNHPRSDGTLQKRLTQHYSGRKNGSVFRKFLGGALLRRRDPECVCLQPAPGKGHWEHQDDKTCRECRPLEDEVSELLRQSFRFRCVEVVDQAERNELESVLIATIAACPVCEPSAAWLGRHAYSDKVRSSGLWNSRDVGGPTITTHQLGRFRSLVQDSLEAFGEGRDAMTTANNPERAGRSRATLFVTHCSKDKNPAGGNAATMYESKRVRRFCEACNSAGVLWAIVSARHALFFPNEWHERYDTRLSFRGGQLCVYEESHPLSQVESGAHIERLVSAIRARLEELSIEKVVYYVETPPGWAVSYLLVIHRALDNCMKEHRSAEEVLKCVETAGRIHLASGMDGLSTAMAAGGLRPRQPIASNGTPRLRAAQGSDRPATPTGAPTADGFRVALSHLFGEGEQRGDGYVDVEAGHLHRQVA